MNNMNLPYQLDRIITIRAPREVVFAFFTENDRWAAWWGAGSTIDPRPGGRVFIQHPGDTRVTGEVLEILPPGRLVMTYGYQSGAPIPPGGSLVTIVLDETPDGSTRLHLRHEFPNQASRDEHVQGWRYQLALFSNAVLNLRYADVATLVDRWMALWTETNEEARNEAIALLVGPDVRFRDRFSATDGPEDLSAHIGGYQRFMPGLRLERRGPVRHCQGTAIADWAAVAADDTPRGSGTNVFTFAPDGRIETVTGFWS
jgi:uncharacterized protein YndB with AHSA1/START domain